MNLPELAERVRAADGVDAFNERSRVLMADRDVARVDLAVLDGDTAIAAALAFDDAPVELAVDPRHRRRGHATALVTRLLADGEDRFWAHGNLAGAQALAARFGLTASRTLLLLRRSGPPPPMEQVPDAVVRTYRDADRSALLEVNSLAFADHPEQASMDDASFERLTHEPWFEASGIFIAEQAGRVVGFHWTKRLGDRGEIYVLGVRPTTQARGVGTALAAHGLRYLSDHGVQQVDLYVEADNLAALALYRSLGFAEIGRDVMFSR